MKAEVCKRPVGRPPYQRNAAEDFIRNLLRHGEYPALDIFILAEENNIALRTLKRAKYKLGATSFQEGGIWYWQLH